jgi:hypothetical protein
VQLQDELVTVGARGVAADHLSDGCINCVGAQGWERDLARARYENGFTYKVHDFGLLLRWDSLIQYSMIISTTVASKVYADIMRFFFTVIDADYFAAMVVDNPNIHRFNLKS